jgi:hypothetical protein
MVSTLSTVPRTWSVGPPARDGAGTRIQKNNNERPTVATLLHRIILVALLVMSSDMISSKVFFLCSGKRRPNKLDENVLPNFLTPVSAAKKVY